MSPKYFFVVFLSFFCLRGWCNVDIPQGTFYFDNSKTKYTVVKFVYGEDSRAVSHVVTMTNDGDGLWSINFPSAVPDQYRYTFAGTELEDGQKDMTFTDLKEYISKTLNCNRTATTSATIIPGGTFVPSSGDNWAQGSWVQGRVVPSQEWSGTLPILHIQTDNGQSVSSKTDYVTGTYWLDNMGHDELSASFGSEAEPLPLKIRGRGNWTWSGFDKKPYRIKLDEKASLCKLNKARNFCLMANADDNMGGLRNEVGFEISRLLHLAWTPASEPVELILNGDYLGLYFITEPVRVGANHVNITEQDDLSDADVTGGWLVEIDNYSANGQVVFKEDNGQEIRFTFHSPEELSSAQREYIKSQLIALNDLIYDTPITSSAWETVIDKDALARYYVVQEIMEDTESFHGSCYFYKDCGEDALWTWGPVWDFGNSFNRHAERFIYDGPSFDQYWIREMSKWNSFQTAVREVWKEFLVEDYDRLKLWIDERVAKYATAAVYDGRRWSKYNYSDTESCKQRMLSNLSWRVNWLKQQWGDYPSGVDALSSENASSIAPIYDLQGRRLSAPPQHGMYIQGGKVWKN